MTESPLAQERLALIYSDGSMGVLKDGKTIEAAREEREFADAHQKDPMKLTKIALVRIEPVEFYPHSTVVAETCPTCGRTHAHG